MNFTANALRRITSDVLQPLKGFSQIKMSGHLSMYPIFCLGQEQRLLTGGIVLFLVSNMKIYGESWNTVVFCCHEILSRPIDGFFFCSFSLLRG